MTEKQEIPLFPLNTVLFPGMVLPLHIFEDRYKQLMQYCITHDEPFGVVLIKEGSEVGGQATIFDIGTTAHITEVDPFDDGRMNVATLGITRFKVHEVYTNKEPYLVGLVEELPFSEEEPEMIEQEVRGLIPILMKYIDIITTVSEAEIALEEMPKDATALAFLTAIVLQAPMEEKQDLLSIRSLENLLREERTLLQRETKMLTLMAKQSPEWKLDSDAPFSPN